MDLYKYILFVGTKHFNSCSDEGTQSLLYSTVYGGALVRETEGTEPHVLQGRLENKEVPFNK